MSLPKDLQDYYPYRKPDDIDKCVTRVAQRANADPVVVEKMLEKVHRSLRVKGPVALYELYSDRYQKRIYLFGEQHVRNAPCPPDMWSEEIPEFIESVIKNTPRTIDVFLELPFISQRFGTKEQPLLDPKQAETIHKFLTKFEPCLQVDKSLCKYPNARIHYTDVRKLPDVAAFNDMFFDMANIRVQVTDGVLTPQQGLNGLKRATIWYKSYFPPNVKELMEKTKVYKQLDNIADHTTRAAIIKYVEDTIKTGTTKYVIDLAKLSALPQNPTKDEFLKATELLAVDYYQPYVALMDAYILGRIFRTFKNASGPDSIITYTGAAHTKNLVTCLQNYLDFKMVRSIGSKNREYCINVGPFLPFFPK